jgi:hypothetical protein
MRRQPAALLEREQQNPERTAVQQADLPMPLLAAGRSARSARAAAPKSSGRTGPASRTSGRGRSRSSLAMEIPFRLASADVEPPAASRVIVRRHRAASSCGVIVRRHRAASSV